MHAPPSVRPAGTEDLIQIVDIGGEALLLSRKGKKETRYRATEQCRHTRQGANGVQVTIILWRLAQGKSAASIQFWLGETAWQEVQISDRIDDLSNWLEQRCDGHSFPVEAQPKPGNVTETIAALVQRQGRLGLEKAFRDLAGEVLAQWEDLKGVEIQTEPVE